MVLGALVCTLRETDLQDFFFFGTSVRCSWTLPRVKWFGMCKNAFVSISRMSYHS